MRSDSLRYKKKLDISSLEAAICNVALFKSMKQKQFRDQIFVSYSEEGVILEAQNQTQWQRANAFVKDFLETKKIALLTFGYDKEAYEQLIMKGLKQYTRRVKEQNEQCPYINIIHYQKLRKSCEYMDKEKYIQPLKDWERKNKTNPNFAFLIVHPPQKFAEVKYKLLEFLLKKQIHLEEKEFCLLQFIILFFNSPLKQEIREAFEKKLIQVSLQTRKKMHQPALSGQKQDYIVKITNYAHLRLIDYDFKIVGNNKNISKLGPQCISSRQLQTELKSLKNFIKGSVLSVKNQTLISATQPFQQLFARLTEVYGEGFYLIPFKKSERDKYLNVINKLVTTRFSKNTDELNKQIQKHIICSYDEIQFISQSSSDSYRIHKAAINDCPYMIHEYSQISLENIDNFLYYLDQLRTYYCTYLVRYYGIALKYGEAKTSPNLRTSTIIRQQKQLDSNQHHSSAEEKIQSYKYFLIFDYHHRTFHQMMESDMIIDNFQVGMMVLQIIHLINFLHTHQEPRCLGKLNINQLYWPAAIVLPYLGNKDQNVLQKIKIEELKQKKLKNTSQRQKINQNLNNSDEGFEGDVRLVGQLMKRMLMCGSDNEDWQKQLQDDKFLDLLKSMLKESKYERISLSKCLSSLEELIVL